MAIAVGFEAQPGLEATSLLTGKIFPSCSPGYLKRHPDLKTMQDIPDQDADGVGEHTRCHVRAA